MALGSLQCSSQLLHPQLCAYICWVLCCSLQHQILWFFSNALELGTVGGKGEDCSFLLIATLGLCYKLWVCPVLRSVCLGELKPIVPMALPHTAASGHEPCFADAQIITRTAEIVQLCWNLSLAHQEEPHCTVIILSVVCLAPGRSRRQCVPAWEVMELEVKTSGSRGPVDH